MPAATLPASTLHHEACDQSYEETTKILFRKHPQRMILEPFELSDIANAIRILGHPSLVCLSHLLHSLFFLSFIFFLPPYKPLPSNHAASPTVYNVSHPYPQLADLSCPILSNFDFNPLVTSPCVLTNFELRFGSSVNIEGASRERHTP